MAGRPRLVHEGSPINDDRGGFVAPRSGHARADNAQHGVASSNLASLASATANARSTTSKPYKLQTRLVVGEDTSDDLDMMAMDEDAHDHNLHHNQRGSNNGLLEDYSTSSYYGSHGHVYHCHRMQQNGQSFGTVQHQQQNVEHMTFGGAQHQQQMPQPPNEFYNNNVHNFVPANPPATPPPPPIHHMPSPFTSPLVVLDGANIAYNYSETLHPCQQSQRRQPDPKGIRLAIDYFLKNNCRVQAVVPTSWYQLKPRPADHYHLKNRTRGDSDAKMVTEEVEELRSLRQQGFLVAIPPGDDDDAFAMALARREEDRLLEQREVQQQDESMGMEDDTLSSQHLPKSVLGGYVISNDMFHDAIRRDDRKQKQNHQYPLNMRPVSLKSWLKTHRISYSFANVGDVVDGEIRLDFLPNPRNGLIEAIDTCNRLNKCGAMRKH